MELVVAEEPVSAAEILLELCSGLDVGTGGSSLGGVYVAPSKDVVFEAFDAPGVEVVWASCVVEAEDAVFSTEFSVPDSVPAVGEAGGADRGLAEALEASEDCTPELLFVLEPRRSCFVMLPKLE